MGGAARRRCNRAAAASVSQGICAFCGSSDQDETTVGRLYQLESTIVHYYCALVSCGLSQRGRDEEGLFGFLLDDILTELHRGKKLKCSYCGCLGATVGCCVSACKKQFHLPCGRRRGAKSFFYGSYKSFCIAHAPTQAIPADILVKARARQSKVKASIKNGQRLGQNVEESEDTMCAICYESVDTWPSGDTFWPPCCARDRWLHTICLQRMSLSAGVHYLKCPLCNERDAFQTAVQEHGVYIPDRDAAWELDNAFADLYERPQACAAAECLCYRGREYDADEGRWELKLCVTCGGEAAHAGCLAVPRLVCSRCSSVRFDAAALDSTPLVTRENDVPEYRPLMTHRMSLRLTKSLSGASKGHRQVVQRERIARICKKNDDKDSDSDEMSSDESVSSSRTCNITDALSESTEHVITSRLELGIRCPTNIRTNTNISEKCLENLTSEKDRFMYAKKGRVGKSISEMEERILSPLKVLEQKIYAQMTGREDEAFRAAIYKNVKKMRRPGPLCHKKKFAGSILEKILEDCRNPIDTESESVASHLDQLVHSTPSKTLKQTSLVDLDVCVSPVSDVSAFPTFPVENCDVNKDSSNSTLEIRCNNSDTINLDSTEERELENSANATEPTLEIGRESDTSFKTSKEFVAEEWCVNNDVAVDSSADDSCVEILVEGPKTNKDELSKSKLPKLGKNKGISDSPRKNRKQLKLKSCSKMKLAKSKLSKTSQVTPASNDLDLLKSQYLSEVDRDSYKCDFDHKHDSNSSKGLRLKTAIDFAIDAVIQKRCDDKLKDFSENTVQPSEFSVVDNRLDTNKDGKIISKENKNGEDLESSKSYADKSYKILPNDLMKLQKELDKVNANFDKAKSSFCKIVKESLTISPENKVTLLKNIVLEADNCSKSDTRANELLNSTNQSLKTDMQKSNLHQVKTSKKILFYETSPQLTTTLSQVTASEKSENNVVSKLNIKCSDSKTKKSKPEKANCKHKSKVKVIKNKNNRRIKFDHDSEEITTKILKDMKSTLENTAVTTLSQYKEEVKKLSKKRASEKALLSKDMKSAFEKLEEQSGNMKWKNYLEPKCKNVNLKSKSSTANKELQNKHPKKRKLEEDTNHKAKKRKKNKISTAIDTLRVDNECNRNKKADKKDRRKSTQPEDSTENEGKRNKKIINYSENHEFMDELDAIDKFYLNNDKKCKDGNKKERKILKQAVLTFSPENKQIAATPLLVKKRKKKTESPDGLKQTTLSSFFSHNLTLT